MDPLLRELDELHSRLRDAGYNIVASVSRYDTEEPLFHTCLFLADSPEAGVTADHAFLDGIRELSVEWSNTVHVAQLTWA